MVADRECSFSMLWEFVEQLKNNAFDFDKFAEMLVSSSVSPFSILETFLNAYIQNNFIGPPSDIPCDTSEIDKCAIDHLSVDGETPFTLARYPSLLWICKKFSRYMLKTSKILKFSYVVFFLKSIYLHQILLGDTRCPSIKTEFDELLSEVELDELQPDFDQLSFSFVQLGSYLAVFYYDFKLADQFKKLAEKMLGLTVDFSAILGTRTKAQENPLPQLVVCIKRNSDKNLFHLPPNESTAQPKICPLEDDNLLDFINFTDDTELRHGLSVSEQAFVLCCGDIHRLSHPHDDLTDEQSLAFVTAIIRSVSTEIEEKSNNIGEPENSKFTSVSWPLLTEALFKRGSLEKRSFARVERALRQMEELTNQFSAKTPEVERRGLEHFFWSRMPACWQIELSHAKLLTRIGSTKSALDIYLRWQQWDDIIASYTALGKRDLAEKVIRERIASGHETPDLYCCLGDVTGDRSHYETAWEHSKHRSARAVRTLGYLAFKLDKDLTKAAEYFETSLLLNRFQVNLWFTLGCCYLQLRDFPKSERAFRFCVTLEPDNFEAWNNLASAVIFSGRRSQALTLLKEATKWNYESWRIWENILLVAVDEGAFGDAITAYHRLIDLRQKHTDPQVLGMLTKAVCENLPDNANNGAARHFEKLLVLFGRATATNPSDADTWRHYATLILNGTVKLDAVMYQRAVQCLQKCYQCRLRAAAKGWELDKKARGDLLGDLQALSKVLLSNSIPTEPETETFLKSALSSLRLSLNTFSSRLKLAMNECFTPAIQDDLLHDSSTVAELRCTADNALNA
uniref:TPR_REGION domain-containing protein n=2 Tax=Mesocestoides corti TaxID=53468 RepID=A0A5K3EQB8_MESCO